MPSDRPEVLEKLRMLGRWVRAQIGGHRVSVVLTDYDESSDSYHGEAHRNYSMNTGEQTPVVESVHGLRPYPYSARPDYAFQFVLPGEDEQPLIDIAQRNVSGTGERPVEQAEDDQAVTVQPQETETPEQRRERKRAERRSKG
jgi:hypothetical protein